MQRRIGHVVIESISAERSKFTASLVFIPGLWCTGAAWRNFMGYFAHRGWDCCALTLRGHADAGTPMPIGRVRWAEHLSDVAAAIGACPAPPVVIGHDVGAALILQSHLVPVRARVALAPVVPAVTATWKHSVSSLQARLAMRWSRPLPVPRGALRTEYLAQGAPGGMVRDSGTLARELVNGAVAPIVQTEIPTLIIAGEHDIFCRAGDLRRLAAEIGAAFLEAANAGHAIPWARGWEKRVSEIHRWLIQTLGDDLLVPEEDA